MSEIQKYISQGEHVQQDFKFAIDDYKKIARTLAAFANTEGGRLLIGIKDNGKIAGCDPEEELHMIVGAAQLYVKPPLEIKSIVHIEGYRQILEIQIEKGKKKEYKAMDESGEWCSYFRWEDHTVKVNKIIQKVWHHAHLKEAKPEVFEENALKILKSLSDQPRTLSKIYRLADVPMKQVDHWLPLFICWGLVEYTFSDPSLLYSLKERD